MRTRVGSGVRIRIGPGIGVGVGVRPRIGVGIAVRTDLDLGIGLPRGAEPARHSSTNCVGTRVVDSTSSFDAVTNFTIVGM